MSFLLVFVAVLAFAGQKLGAWQRGQQPPKVQKLQRQALDDVEASAPRPEEADHEDDDSTQVVGGSNRVRSGQHTGKSKSSSRSWMKLLDEDDGQASSVRGSHDAAADAHTTEQMQKEKAAPQVVPKKKKKGTSKTFRHRSAISDLD